MTALEPVFTAELANQVEDSEDRAVQLWLDSLVSPHTRRSYETAMKGWREHLRARDVLLQSPRRADMDAWRHKLETDGKKPKTVDSRMIAIRAFYDYLAAEIDGYGANPVRGAKLLNRGPHSQTQALSRDDLRALTARARKAGPDRWLLMLFLATTGCRISEAINLKVEDLGRNAGHCVATLTRKGGRRDEVSVDAQVFNLLTEHVKDSAPDHHVFQPHRTAGRTGGPFTYAGAYKAVRDLGAATVLGQDSDGKDVTLKVHPHMLRATLATQAIDAGKEITDVQDQLGHAKTETTRLYDRGGRRLRRMASVAGVMAEMVDLGDEA